jgi:hypothetical protein
MMNHHEDDTGGLLAVLVGIIALIAAIAAWGYVLPKIFSYFYP